MGVSRVLFEIALDYKYREVELTLDDRGAIKMFKLLQYAILTYLLKFPSCSNS